MDLVFNHSTADSSFRRFPDLARKIFQQPAKPVQALKCLVWISGLKRLLLDGKYDDHMLDETLKAALGPDRRIFDVDTTCGTGSRVAIIASRISDGKACLLANYRGIGRHGGMSAYEFLMPQSQTQNLLLWEVYVITCLSVARPLSEATFMDRINLTIIQCTVQRGCSRVSPNPTGNERC
jgi:hypothetical protein